MECLTILCGVIGLDWVKVDKMEGSRATIVLIGPKRIACFRGDIAYVWHAGIHAGDVAQGLNRVGFDIRAQIIWVKQHFALSRGHYHWQHEPAWYAVRHGAQARWCGDRSQSTVWEIPNFNPFEGAARSRASMGLRNPLIFSRSRF
jgi:hypothetical protein